MADLVLSNVLVSAGVAALTTLGIEFAAKPSLEARKERILFQHRERRELARKLLVLEARIQDAPRRVQARGASAVLPDIIAASDALSSDREVVRELCPPEIAYLINYRLGVSAALLDASAIVDRTQIEGALEDPEARKRWEKTSVDLIRGILNIYDASWTRISVTYLRTPSSRFIKRRRLIREARAVRARQEAEENGGESSPATGTEPKLQASMSD